MKEENKNNGAAQKKCFVVGPIGAKASPTRTHADWLLNGIIKPTFAEKFSEFDVIRSDTITSPGMIDTQMINHLLEAELVIVDMSLLNANAFYEMGIRHMVAKPVIHMFLDGTEIPFDVKPYRAIGFQLLEHHHLIEAKARLAEAVSEAIGPNYVADNPVTKARGYQKIEQTGTPQDKLIFHEMEALRQELAAVKRWAKPARTVDSIRSSVFPKPLTLGQAHGGSERSKGQVEIYGQISNLPEGLIEEIMEIVSRELGDVEWWRTPDTLSLIVDNASDEVVANIANRLETFGVMNIKARMAR